MAVSDQLTDDALERLLQEFHDAILVPVGSTITVRELRAARYELLKQGPDLIEEIMRVRRLARALVGSE